MTIRDMVYVALFAAIVAVLGLFPPITLPTGVPITAQSLGVMLAGSVIGAKRGGLALVVFVALVAVGAPILAGGRSGFGIFFGPTAGFLLSWPVAAFLIGWLTERSWHQLSWLRSFAFNVVGGILVIYAAGIPWLVVAADLGLVKAFTGSVAFIPGDLIKAALAAFIAVTVKRAYPVIDPRSA